MAYRPSNGLGETGLVFWDGAVKLEQLHALWLVGVKQHPDRDGVREPAGERAEHDHHDRPQEGLGNHGNRLFIVRP